LRGWTEPFHTKIVGDSEENPLHMDFDHDSPNMDRPSCADSSLILWVVSRVHVFEADRPDRCHLGDVLARSSPVEMRSAAGQDDDSTRRIGHQLFLVELLPQPYIEHTGHDRIDTILMVPMRH
jgi:hypothetical protein